MMPSNHGPDLVARLLDRSVSLLKIDQLGLTRLEINRLKGLMTPKTASIGLNANRPTTPQHSPPMAKTNAARRSIPFM
jgi:hypothetical protein